MALAKKIGVYWLILFLFLSLVFVVQYYERFGLPETSGIQRPLRAVGALPETGDPTRTVNPTRRAETTRPPAILNPGSPAGTGGPSPTPKPIIGIGVMGDSNSDEYRADDNRGTTFSDVTLNWVEQLVLKRGLNFGPWGEWGEPRRSGYKYNWARSSVSTKTMITSGQHTGLAEQVANGEVSHVILYIGGADFHLERGTYEAIYNGSMSDAQVQSKIDKILENLTLAVDTVLNAGEVQMVVVKFLDKDLAPDTLRRFPHPAGRRRVSEAIRKVNAGIDALAEERGIAVADINEFSLSLLVRMDQHGNLNVGGELINILERGNDPHHLQLKDRSGHMGTVLSGLLANAILVEPFNREFGLNIKPLSDLEILENAGLR